MATTKKTQISGQAAAPSKQLKRPPAKSPWDRVNRELDRFDKRLRKLNPF